MQVNSTTSVWARDPTISNKFRRRSRFQRLLLFRLELGSSHYKHLYELRATQVSQRARDPARHAGLLLDARAVDEYGDAIDTVYKNMTGRFRPYFYDMCKGQYDVVWDGVTNLCQSPSGKKEG